MAFIVRHGCKLNLNQLCLWNCQYNEENNVSVSTIQKMELSDSAATPYAQIVDGQVVVLLCLLQPEFCHFSGLSYSASEPFTVM